ILPTNGAEFSLCEEAGKGDWSLHLRDNTGIVIGLGEESCSSAIAAEEQRALAGARSAVCFQQEAQILIRCERIAHMELHGWANADALGDSERPRVAVHADHIANEKVAAPESLLVLADDPADMKAVLHQVLIARRQFGVQRLQLRHRRLTAEFDDDIV